MDRETGNALIVPLDHGVSYGPMKGLSDLKDAVNDASAGGATAVIMHKGMIEHAHRGSGKDVGLAVHLSASAAMTEDCHKALISSVEEAVTLGADAVSMHIVLGCSKESEMLRDLGLVSKECRRWGMPLIVRAEPSSKDRKYDSNAIAHCARVASELGADIIRVNYTGTPETFSEVVKSAVVPVVISGGPDMKSETDILRTVYDSLQAGGRGASIDGDIYLQRNVRDMTRAIADIVLFGADVEEASKNLR